MYYPHLFIHCKRASMKEAIEVRFDRYCDPIVEALSHADRRQPAQWYLKGLMLSGERKSVEPMAARVHPQNVRSAHQSMHHLVADAPWEDRAVLAAVAQQVVPQLLKKDKRCWWILDDTGHAKKGVHSVGVSRQYCGRLGKTDNGQVAVSLSLANRHGSVPLAYEMYLPKEWSEDAERRARAGVPAEMAFRTQGQMARAQLEAALTADTARGIVLADAAYGDETDFRDGLSGQELEYVVAVRAGTSVWWGEYQPARSAPESAGRGRPRTRLQRDAEHQPSAVLELAHVLPAKAWRKVRWREGVAGTLSSRFARVRVRAAHRDQARAEQWLLIEWPVGAAEPIHYWLANLSEQISFKQLVFHAKGRWMIERDYQELKSELGLSHYEGRNWRGFHHHATLCIAAYGFLMLERLTGKKNSARFKTPPLPKGFRARGSGADAAPRALVDPQRSLSSRSRHRSNPGAMPLLRNIARRRSRSLIPQ
jgi:SRSO17 transposase